MSDHLLDQIKRERLQSGESNPGQTAGSDTEQIKSLYQELAKYPEIKRHPGIRLEEAIDKGLTRYCKDNGITLELFLESAWIFCQDNRNTLNAITSEAKVRYSKRKKIGHIKRLIAMLEKMSSSVN